MTRCKYCCSYNNQLKSSAYNPTGQCYELRSTAHKAMTNHLRRLLLAKSVVDSGKRKSRVNDKRNTKSNVSCKRDISSTKELLSQDVINRLAYDTKRHPHELVSMNWKSVNDNRSNSTDSSENSSIRDHRDEMKNYNDKFEATFRPRKIDTRSLPSRERFNENKHKHKSNDTSRERDEKFEKSFRSVIPRLRSSSETLLPRTPEFVASTSDLNISDKILGDVSTYIKFVYDITKEIMERGYYSDKEIERVFRKHFERNLGKLNENKMLREINCIKRSLNINYESDSEEENKIVTIADRSEFQAIEKSSEILENRTEINKKIDPFKEIIVTKEDVLTTLLEMDFNREKAEEICKSLENRSKEMLPNQELNNIKKFEKIEASIQDDKISLESEITAQSLSMEKLRASTSEEVLAISNQSSTKNVSPNVEKSSVTISETEINKEDTKSEDYSQRESKESIDEEVNKV